MQHTILNYSDPTMNPLTNHARIRCQQRGISPMEIDLLIQFGATEKSYDGTVKHFWNKESRRRLETYTGRRASKADARLNWFVVVGWTGAVVTTGHRTKRITRH